jgi:hypothetical protein
MIAQRVPAEQLRLSLGMLAHTSVQGMQLLNDNTNDVAKIVG